MMSTAGISGVMSTDRDISGVMSTYGDLSIDATAGDLRSDVNSWEYLSSEVSVWLMPDLGCPAQRRRKRDRGGEMLWELLQPIAFKILAHFGHDLMDINAGEKHARCSLLMDLVPAPSTCKGLRMATLSVSLFPSK